MDKEVIYERAKALKEDVERIEGSDVVNKMIVDSCNTLIQEAKAIEKDNLIDLQEVSWDENTNCASKTEIIAKLGQIVAILRPKFGWTGA